MKIIDFCDSPDNAVTYLVIKGNDALIIDPANDVRIMEKYLTNINVKGILITHGHYDHFRSLNELRIIHPVKVYLNSQALKKLADPSLSCGTLFHDELIINLNKKEYELVNDNDEIIIGEFKIKVLYLPGHTNCSVGYLIDNELFIGDVLFKNSIGRYDLPTGSFNATLSTLRRIKNLDDKIIIHPGHDEAFTLKEAKAINEFLKLE